MAWQTIVSRSIDPLQGVVISVGTLSAGSTYNVIPDSARLELSVRTFSAEIRQQLEERITRICMLQAESFGLQHANTGDAFFQRSEEHTSELQSLMRISYAVFCLKK